jgi:ABC-2 type transport system ATP-binding protein
MASPPAPEPVLEIAGLRKTYRVGIRRRAQRPALEGLDLSVMRGEIFGYLGPNGSGKTTTLKLLMGLIHPDAGSARILGRPLQDRGWRYRVGYLPEHPYLYDYLTAEEYLDYVGRLFGMAPPARRARGRELLERVGLDRSGRVPLRRFSKGMVQRAGVAQALMNDPELVFLDEPMSGLDPLGRRLVRNLIVDLKRAGKTVFFSTHILSDAETLCDRVAVLSGGRLLNVGRLDEILDLGVNHVEVLAGGLSAAARQRLPEGVAAHAVGERWRLEVPEGMLADVLSLLLAERCRLLAVQPIRQSLEDYFFREMASAEGPQTAWPLQD